jgi:hypothetical protein
VLRVMLLFRRHLICNPTPADGLQKFRLIISSSIYRWVVRYEKGGLPTLVDQTHRPQRDRAVAGAFEHLSLPQAS